MKQIDFDGKFEYSKIIQVDVDSPTQFGLTQNYPNPFNPTTKISFNLPEAARVKLVLYNSIGQKIKELVNENKEAGNYSVEFNAGNLPSGIYYYRIVTGNFTDVKKMILLK